MGHTQVWIIDFAPNGVLDMVADWGKPAPSVANCYELVAGKPKGFATIPTEHPSPLPVPFLAGAVDYADVFFSG